MKKLVIATMLVAASTSSFAGRFWTGDLGDWKLSLNNGVAYINSTAFPAECKYNRAQINFDGTEYTKALWSYVLAASKAGNNIEVVLDHDRNSGADTVTCRIYSAQTR